MKFCGNRRGLWRVVAHFSLNRFSAIFSPSFLYFFFSSFHFAFALFAVVVLQFALHIFRRRQNMQTSAKWEVCPPPLCVCMCVRVGVAMCNILCYFVNSKTDPSKPRPPKSGALSPSLSLSRLCGHKSHLVFTSKCIYKQQQQKGEVGERKREGGGAKKEWRTSIGS